MNPANVPKVRPIEDFLGFLKRKVYENDWSAQNIDQLIASIKWALTKIDTKTFQRLGEAVSRRLYTVAR
jgi:hypothetical protein